MPVSKPSFIRLLHHAFFPSSSFFLKKRNWPLGSATLLPTSSCDVGTCSVETERTQEPGADPALCPPPPCSSQKLGFFLCGTPIPPTSAAPLLTCGRKVGGVRAAGGPISVVPQTERTWMVRKQSSYSSFRQTLCFWGGEKG